MAKIILLKKLFLNLIVNCDAIITNSDLPMLYSDPLIGGIDFDINDHSNLHDYKTDINSTSNRLETPSSGVNLGTGMTLPFLLEVQDNTKDENDLNQLYNQVGTNMNHLFNICSRYNLIKYSIRQKYYSDEKYIIITCEGLKMLFSCTNCNNIKNSKGKKEIVYYSYNISTKYDIIKAYYFNQPCSESGNYKDNIDIICLSENKSKRFKSGTKTKICYDRINENKNKPKDNFVDSILILGTSLSSLITKLKDYYLNFFILDNNNNLGNFDIFIKKYNKFRREQNAAILVKQQSIYDAMFFLIYYYPKFYEKNFDLLEKIYYTFHPTFILKYATEFDILIKEYENIFSLIINNTKNNSNTNINFTKLLSIVEKALNIIRLPVENNPILKRRDSIDLNSLDGYFFCMGLIVMNYHFFLSFESIILKIESICNKLNNPHISEIIFNKIATAISFEMKNNFIPLLLNNYKNNNTNIIGNNYLRSNFNEDLERIMILLKDYDSNEKNLLLYYFQSLYSHYYLLYGTITIFSTLNIRDEILKAYHLYSRDLIIIVLTEVYKENDESLKN